ncbi:isoquinoline 1-oxidoreductase alpha subunit [Luminiphilus syltensis NOR5-1B]|uniref:Isoquinoline 1-oxidoreductase alpha subunit n=1 Tax=Luminiphilus syltensis NOR5-1B TaxID=565045 RepID=B8KXV6_9GAMM|nr:(2Fe-2S)-binding protein [Luminiphilus syltensis]EED34415.1 isoquinoline 1-oxidoreductase alpha subunit [Luminiphilus syltensis NOR5-1B]
MTTLNINGEVREVSVDPQTPLLWALRDTLAMTGTKYGCGIAQCGACTVHVNGAPVRSCQLNVGDAEGMEITTIEGAESKAIEALRVAWNELDVPQCGYCQSGQLMSAASLLERTPKPSDQDIDNAMSGNLCRCATYQRIRAGIHRAADILEA